MSCSIRMVSIQIDTKSIQQHQIVLICSLLDAVWLLDTLEYTNAV